MICCGLLLLSSGTPRFEGVVADGFPDTPWLFLIAIKDAARVVLPAPQIQPVMILMFIVLVLGIVR